MCIRDSIIDFTSGSAYALHGNLQKISNFIVIATPHGVDISGDIQSLMDSDVYKRQRRCISLLDSAHLDDISVIVNAYDKHMVRRHQMISDNDITALLSTRICLLYTSRCV